MALPRIRLVYLPFRAMAETTRMILAHGGVTYEDEAVWGPVFAARRRQRAFPWDKTPVLELLPKPDADADAISTVVAQSGAIARYAAKLAGVHPQCPRRCAEADSVYELGQELCTINPLVNCFTGRQFEMVRAHYFSEVGPRKRNPNRAPLPSIQCSPDVRSPALTVSLGHRPIQLLLYVAALPSAGDARGAAPTRAHSRCD